MARVMICDDDREMVAQLVAALRAADHEASSCRHTMDALREIAGSRFDIIVFGLDMAGFGGAGAIEAIRELAPQVALIGLHRRPSEIMRSPAHRHLIAILPRPVPVPTFMYAVARALEIQQMRASPSAHGL